MAEAKITVKSDTTQAKKDVQEFGAIVDGMGNSLGESGKKLKDTGAATKQLGEQEKQTKGDTDELALAFQRMSSMELAGKIQEIAGALGDLGKIAEGVAKNDVNAFRSGMESATRAAVNGVALIAPQFAPIVAIIGVVIGKVAEWALGMEDAAAVIKSMNEQLENHIIQLDRTARLAKASAQTEEEAFRVQQESLTKLLQAKSAALANMVREEGKATEESIKLNRETEEIRLQILINQKEREKEIRKEAAEDQKKQSTEVAKTRTEAEKESAEESKKIAEESREDMAKAMEQSHELFIEGIERKQEAQAEANEKEIEEQARMFEREANERQKASESLQEILDADLAAIDVATLGEEEASRRRIEAYQRVANSAAATAEQRKAAEKSVTTEQKKALDAQIKAYEDMAKKAGSTIAGMVQGLIFEHKSLKEVVSETVKQLAASVIQSLVAMAATAIAKAVMTAAGVGAAKTVEGAAHASVIAPAVSSWAAAIPFAGPGIAATYIGMFRALIAASRIGFQEGYSPGMEGSPPGMGRADTIPANISASETVLSENQTGKLTALLDRLSSGSGAATGSVPTDVQIRVSVKKDFDDRSLAGKLLSLLDIEVMQYNGKLTASHLK